MCLKMLQYFRMFLNDQVKKHYADVYVYVENSWMRGSFVATIRHARNGGIDRKLVLPE